MCFNLIVMCVVIWWGSVGFVCLFFFGISEFFLLKGLSDVVFFVLFVDSVVFCDVRSFGVFRKFLFFFIDINDGVIEFFFFIFILDLLGIIDFFWLVILFLWWFMLGVLGKVEDFWWFDLCGWRIFKKFDFKLLFVMDEVLFLRWVSGFG